MKLSLLLLLLCGIANAQVLLPSAESAFEPQHRFNPAFVREKGIRKITFDIIDKKDFQVAVDKSLTEVYEFSPSGLLTRFYYTVVRATHERHVTTVGRHNRHFTRVISEFVYDTVGTTYTYGDGKLLMKRYHDGSDYYESRYYRYNQQGELTKELRYRETNNSPDPSYFMLGNQVLLSADSFQYQHYGTRQVKCIQLNDENRPYKERIINFDSLGRERSVDESYVAAGWIRQRQDFEYANGHLTRARFDMNSGSPVKLLNTYEYDQNGELYNEKQYRNETLIREISYVSDKATGLLNSFVMRDPINLSMRIVKLRYDTNMVGSNR